MQYWTAPLSFFRRADKKHNESLHLNPDELNTNFERFSALGSQQNPLW
jgi:hypothetical protein